jgi:hypothetical protein
MYKGENKCTWLRRNGQVFKCTRVGINVHG